MNIKSRIVDLIVSIVGAAIFSLLAAAFPAFSVGNIGTAVGLRVLNNLFAQLAVLTITFFIALIGVRRLFEWNRERRKPSPGPPIAIVKRPPRNVLWGGFIEKYGVLWRARYGQKRFGGTFAHIEGPFCPNCGTKLNTGEKTRFIRGKAEVWHCPDCGKDYIRPVEAYLNEADNVKKVCESVAGRAEQNGIEVIEERNDFHTKEWNTQSGPHYSQSRSY